MLCHEVRGLLEAYAAGALGGAEQQAVDEHLNRGCEDCGRELADLTIAAMSLAAAEEAVSPPPSVKADLMRRINGESPRETPTVEPATAPRPNDPPRAWRAYAGVAIAASLLGVLAAQIPDWVNPIPGGEDPSGLAQAEADLEAYRQRIAETNRVLGLGQTGLIQVSANPLDTGPRPQLIHDGVSRQLHVLVPNASLRGDARSGWAWITRDGGEAIASAPIAPVGDSHSVAVLDLPDRLADASQLLLTFESVDDPREPSLPAFGKTRLLFPQPE